MRNLLGNHKVLYDKYDNEIKWSYFIELHELSKERCLTTHKLTRKHIEFKSNEQKVRLAAETFSQSVVDSMKIAQQEKEELSNCDPTIQFIERMDTIFNILNARNKRSANIFKCPLNNQNKRIIYHFIDECISYLKSLKIMVKRKRNNCETKIQMNVLETVNKTPVLGFIMDLTNLRLFYEECVEQEKLKNKIITYSFSQDHVEILFFRKYDREMATIQIPILSDSKAHIVVYCAI